MSQGIRTRESMAAFLGLFGLVLVAPAGPAYAVPCYYIAKANAVAQPHTQCAPGSGFAFGGTIWSFDCNTGQGPGVLGCDVPYDQILELSPFRECSPIGTTFPLEFASDCAGDKSAPSECKVGGVTSNGSRDGSGQVGDPVDLRTGALSLDPVDVDLGRGLRLARHYASNGTQSMGMGKKWSHSLEWKVTRFTPTHGGPPGVIVEEPLRTPVPFFLDGTAYVTSPSDGGSLTIDGSGNGQYKSSAGLEADFDSQNEITQIRYPGELPIDLNYGTNSVTFTKGAQSLILTTNSNGRLSSLSANGETWSYSYTTSGFLETVIGPDPSTPSTSDTMTWTYVYTTPSSGLIQRVDRTTSLGTTAVGNWVYNGQNRVSSADEQALEQSLLISYSTPQAGTFRATVTNASSDLLALYDSRTTNTPDRGVVTAVTNPTGPAAPVPGGPGVPVPFVSSTTIGSKSPLTKTRTDKNGNVSLYENYDGDGRPGRTVRGWIDGPTDPGVYSADDQFASLEETVWHPVLRQPLAESSPSVLQGGGTRETIYDYDDPAAPVDDPLLPNEAPADRIHSRTEEGFTVDDSGTITLAAYKTVFTYDAVGHITSESGPRSENYTEHDYDATTGHRTHTRRYVNGTGSGALETTFSNFDSRGNPQTVTDPNGQVTTYTYDTLDRVKTITSPYSGASSEITFTYDIDGNLTQVDFPPDTFAQPYFIKFGYDTKRNPTFIADAAGNAIVYERTAGRVTRQERYASFVDLSNRGIRKGDATFHYDSAGRMDKAFNPLDSAFFTAITPDANGNPEVVIDENGKTDNRLYDALDRLEKISQVRGATTYVTDFEYDLNSNLVKITDPAAKDTLYEHDDFGRLVEVTSPNTGVTLYVYDAGGNLATKIENFAGTPRPTHYSYDGLDRLTGIDLPTTADWVFTYDGSATLNQKGRLTSASNGTVTTTREYFPRGDLQIERTTIGGIDYEVEYEYDAAGNRTSVQTPSGVKSVYAFSGGHPATITVDPGANQQVIQEVTFDPFGGRTQAKFPPSNSVVSTRSYDLRGQVASVSVTSPAGAVIDRILDYKYTTGGTGPTDPGPNLDQITDLRDASQSRYFHYDSLDRIWKSTTAAGSSLYQYGYDANGNPTTGFAGGTVTGRTYVAGTDLIATSGFSFGFGGITTYYAHDAYGNRIWDAVLTPYSGQPMHYYDDQNQLVEYRSWTNPSVPLAQYDYDAFGRRVRKITSASTTLYFYGSSGRLIEERVLATNATRSYVWLEDEPMGIVDSGPTPKYSWIHNDYLGMPIAVTSTPAAGNAQTVWRANYAPFGLAGVFTDPDGDGQQFSLALRFPGQYFDGESNLHYNWHRYYDPSIGRYISADPIGQVAGGDANVYAYVGNVPTGFTDPDGLFSIGLSTPVGVAAAGAPATVAAAVGAAGVVGFGLGTLVEPYVEDYVETALDYYLGDPLADAPPESTVDDCETQAGKRRPYEPDKPGRKKQGREAGEKKRKKDDWTPRNPPREPKPHTPSKKR